MSILLKRWSGTKLFCPYILYPLPAFLTPLPIIPFTTEEITGCTNEAAKGANKVPRNPPSYFLVSFFTVSVTLNLLQIL